MKEIPNKDLPPDLAVLAAREKLPVYRITDWEPFEASLVTVPADPTVGVGRSADPDPERGDLLEGDNRIQEGDVGDGIEVKDAKPPPEGGDEKAEEELAPTPTPAIEEERIMPEPKQEIDLSQYEQDMEKQRKKAGG